MSTHTTTPFPPSQTFHPSFMPKPSSPIRSVAAGAHYSGAKVHHRRSDVQRASFGSGDSSEAQLSERCTQILDDLDELYACHPSPEIFRRSWREDAVFEDPLSLCRGVNEVAAQPKIISNSRRVSRRVLSSTHDPNRVIYAQTQEYTLRVIGMKRTIKSVVVVELDEEDKIARLEDRWNGEEAGKRWGVGTLRRLNGKVMPWIVRGPST
ncbi:hypothetical protein M0805_003056 [Coniferiporia weirii]|nr:hypothetical protein M0805_003056 [Coniferiporia weirii]